MFGSDLDSLLAHGGADGVDIRPALLRVTTDLYVSKPHHSALEEQNYIEMALRLIDAVDATTREAVAARLAGHPRPPEPVMARLQSRWGLASPAQASAAPAVVAATTAAFELHALFLAADADERRLMLHALADSLWQPAATPAENRSAEAVLQLEVSALAHDHSSFADELARALDIPAEVAGQVIDDPSGELLVVAALALGMAAPVLQRILLCLTPAIAQSIERVYGLADLHEEIERAAALRLVALWQAIGPAGATMPVSTPTPMPVNEYPAEAERAIAPPPEMRLATPPQRPVIAWEMHAADIVTGM